MRPGLGDEVDRDHLSRLRSARLGGRYQNVVGDAPVLGYEEQHTVLGVQPADDPAVCALQHFHHFADGAAAHVAARDAHGGAVAVHELAHLRRREENRRAAFVGHEKTVPVGMALDAAGDEREAPRHQQAAGAVLHHLARALGSAKPSARIRRRAWRGTCSRASELLARERCARGVQRAEDALRVQRRGSISAFAATRFFSLFSLTRQIPATKIAPPLPRWRNW